MQLSYRSAVGARSVLAAFALLGGLLLVVEEDATTATGASTPSRRSTAASAAVVAASDAERGTIGCSWKAVPSPNVGNGYLAAVAAGSAGGVWAVGSAGRRPLVEHWDGTSWRVAASPSVRDGSLSDVGIAADADVWAVGASGRTIFRQGAWPKSRYRPLIEHWDGEQWTRVDAPGRGELYGLAVVAPDDAWAVGTDWTNDPKPVLLHWDGRAWSVPATRPSAKVDGWRDVAALAANDVWLLGGGKQNVVSHWDGATWRSFALPETKGGYGDQLAWHIAELSPSDVWVAGGEDLELTGYTAPDLWHWNGTVWSKLHGPRHRTEKLKAPAIEGQLAAVTVQAPNIVLTTGYDTSPWDESHSTVATLVEGGSWQYSELARGQRLESLAIDADGTAWGIGYVGSGFNDETTWPARMRPLVVRSSC